MKFETRQQTALRRFFYWRSRYVDRCLLVLIPTCLWLLTDFYWIGIGIFSGVGAWLIFGRHKSTRVIDSSIASVSTIFAVYALARIVVDVAFIGSLAAACEPFPTFYLFLTPIIVGLVLVKHPLKHLVWGCRIAILIAVPVTISGLIEEPSARLSFGTNPVIAAFWFMMFACMGRLNLKSDHSLVGGVPYFYLGFIPALATGSKLAVLFFTLSAAFDVMRVLLSHEHKLTWQLSSIAVLAVSAFVALLIIITQDLAIYDRFSALANQFIGESETKDKSGVLRLTMWKLGWELFLQRPLFGYGTCSMELLIPGYIATELGIPRDHTHLHNVYIDELAGRGLVGFGLMILLHFLVFARILKSSVFSQSEKTAARLALFAICLYGVTGSHQTDGRMISIVIVIMAVFLAELHRREKSNRTASLRAVSE